MRMVGSKALPVRPLPSVNGWMVSNCAWAMAACARIWVSFRPAWVIRSFMSPGTRLASMATKSAPTGLALKSRSTLDHSASCQDRGLRPDGHAVVGGHQRSAQETVCQYLPRQARGASPLPPRLDSCRNPAPEVGVRGVVLEAGGAT